MSKSLGNVVDPHTIIEGGRNSKVGNGAHYNSRHFLWVFSHVNDLLLKFISALGRKHLAMALMSCDSGFLV